MFEPACKMRPRARFFPRSQIFRTPPQILALCLAKNSEGELRPGFRPQFFAGNSLLTQARNNLKAENDLVSKRAARFSLAAEPRQTSREIGFTFLVSGFLLLFSASEQALVITRIGGVLTEKGPEDGL